MMMPRFESGGAFGVPFYRNNVTNFGVTHSRSVQVEVFENGLIKSGQEGRFTCKLGPEDTFRFQVVDAAGEISVGFAVLRQDDFLVLPGEMEKSFGFHFADGQVLVDGVVIANEGPHTLSSGDIVHVSMEKNRFMVSINDNPSLLEHEILNLDATMHGAIGFTKPGTSVIVFS